ncbi:DOMON domain-containing protein [Operophtera brumata]|uniref:DOMON domain-containing protein n=1 Tax=Operophtera brumata TaxID=104452 RepID=A0A0L7LQT0_OPEBR|nr:DOMON domain-containing protein [Operophtera brumata]
MSTSTTPCPRAGCANSSKLNCEVLHDELAFEVRWAVAEDSIVVQLVAKLEDGEYMSFGISGDKHHSQMVGGDVAVAWVDKGTLKGEAVDYYLDAKSQCAGENTNSVKLMNSVLANGYSIVTYQRTLKAADELDLPVLTNQSQPIIWAIGPLNSRNEVSYHHHFTKGDKFIEFGRPPVWNCPRSEGEEEHHPEPPRKEHHKEPVRESIPAIECYEPADGVFYAQMGPTGGKQGYSAITGKDEEGSLGRSLPSSATSRQMACSTPRWDLPAASKGTPPSLVRMKSEPWEIPAIECYEPADGVFYAQIGPTGGKQGYSAITGKDEV